MSSHDQAVVSLLAKVALSLDGAFLGATLAYVAVRSAVGFMSNSAAFHKLRDAPAVGVRDIQSLLPPDDSAPSDDSNSLPASEPTEGEGLLMIVGGTVEAKFDANGSGKSLKPNILFSQESGDKAVVIQRTQSCIYNEWKGFFGWTSDLHSIFMRSWRERVSTTMRSVPFVLVEGGNKEGQYVNVNMDGSRHPLPLMTVYHQLQPVNASPYTFLQALFGHEYPVGLLDEEKILPPGKEVSAVGLCYMKNGIPEIKSCNNLPYFLTEMSKDQMINSLELRTKVLFWTAVVVGTVSIGVLGFSMKRNWIRYKEWRRRRRERQEAQRAAAEEDAEVEAAASEDEESVNIPDGQLCVVCLTRRRRSAFVPCGHMVCCQRCALSVERESSPKCPVCRQSIYNSVRIYSS